MSYFNFSFYIVLDGIVFSALAVLVERLLIRYGYTRGATVWVIIGCFFLAFVKQLENIGREFYLFWFAASILIALTLNRNDIISSIKKGPWWWKSEESLKKE